MHEKLTNTSSFLSCPRRIMVIAWVTMKLQHPIHSKLSVHEMAERVSKTGLVETEILNEVPDTHKGLNCKTYELYFWPKNL